LKIQFILYSFINNLTWRFSLWRNCNNNLSKFSNFYLSDTWRHGCVGGLFYASLSTALIWKKHCTIYSVQQVIYQKRKFAATFRQTELEEREGTFMSVLMRMHQLFLHCVTVTLRTTWASESVDGIFQLLLWGRGICSNILSHTSTEREKKFENSQQNSRLFSPVFKFLV